MSDYRFQMFMIKHAKYLVSELKEKAKRFEIDDEGILPLPRYIKSKMEINWDSFSQKHGGRNLILNLFAELMAARPQRPLFNALKDLVENTYQLTDFLIPLKVIPAGGPGEVLEEENEEEPKQVPDFMEAYLVKESCIIRVKRRDSAYFVKEMDDSKYKSLTVALSELIGCLQTLNTVLIEKQRKIRIKRFLELVSEFDTDSDKEEEEEEEAEKKDETSEKKTGQVKKRDVKKDFELEVMDLELFEDDDYGEDDDDEGEDGVDEN